MANSWKATARKYLKSMHGDKKALKAASAEYHGGGKRRRNPGTDWGKIALVAGGAYIAYKYLLPQLQQPATTPVKEIGI